MTRQKFEIQSCREWSLDMIHRYLQGRFDHLRSVLPARWADERESVWTTAYKLTADIRCGEYEARASGMFVLSEASDPRRLPRLLDRLSTLKVVHWKGEELRPKVEAAFDAYRHPEMTEGEGRYINCVPSIPVFERPLPAGGNYRYPCAVDDIRRQLALVPEYDIEGIQEIGLAHPDKKDKRYFGFYYHWWYRKRTPSILLHSVPNVCEYALWGFHQGDAKRRYQICLAYGMRIQQRGYKSVACWSEEAIRRYIVEYTLLHEIGHHVFHQQRERAGFRCELPGNIHEQFADDYAIRFNRRQQSAYGR